MRATGPLVAPAWIGACVFSACALLVSIATLAGTFSSPRNINFACVGVFAAASLLLLPPLWRTVKSHWLNAIRVVVAILFAYAGSFLIPVESHGVKVDLPPAARR